MKFPINLSSQPFRKDRPMLLASAAVGLLLVISLGILISVYFADRRESAETRRVIDRLEEQLRRATTEQARLDGVLRQPENAEVLERSLFLNALLYRKSISWTKVFADLEKILPHNVRIINIRPQVLSESRVYLEMTVGAEAPEPVVDMLRRFEASELFGATTMYSFVPPTQSEPLYRYRISVNYAQKL
jgi:Tfp pilus assembly protein PilN